MEPLIIVSLLVSLAALAPRYNGNDSRDSFNSVEHWYARRGRRW
jgi:hypothetical protein